MASSPSNLLEPSSTLDISEAQLRLLIENLPELCWIANPDGYIFWYNGRWHAYCGTTPAEMEGWGWQSVHDPRVLPAVLERWQQCIASQAPFEMTFPLRGADGKFRPFLTRIQPCKDSEGRVLWWVGTNTDVTAQMEAEERLKDLNASLERQVAERAYELTRTWEVSPDLWGVLNREGFFERSNPSWARILGWSAEEILTMKFFDFVHPDDLPKTHTAWDEASKGKPALRFENRYRCKTGGWRWLSWVAVPEREKVYCTARDITEDKAAAEELALQTRERHRLWESSPDLLVVLDVEGTVRQVNPAWTTILGYQPSELIGRHVKTFGVPEDIELTERTLKDAANGPYPSVENRFKHKDGSTRWLSWVASPSGGEIYATGRHITAEKEAHLALARTEEALRQSQKMEAVGQLTGGLAHDFNNLLTGMMGSMEMARTRMVQGRFEEIERYMDVAQSAGRRAASLTQRLLAFSRRQTLDPKPTDTNRLIAGMEELIRRTIGPAITLEVVGAVGLWPTLIDPSQLENALLNLCLNGRDAMPGGGRLTIETGNKWLDQRAASERDIPSGQYISVCVTDTGTGMTSDVIARAFDPFFTTKPLGEGTGLGLSMIYGFARQSGGQVRIYSEIDRGTTVCLYLPRDHETPEEVVEIVTTQKANVRGSGEVVLVVDDEPSIRMLISEILDEGGYTSIEVGDGLAALKILQSNAKIDLLITDVGLPGGMNGRQVADAGQTLRENLKVLFITGYAENAVVGNGHLSAGMHLLTKPFTLEALARRIREILEG